MSSEATPTVGVYDVLAWLETNKRSLIGAFVAAVVIGFGISIYRYSADRKELAASDALLKLKTSNGQIEPGPQPDPSAYLKVVSEYPGTSAAERALLLGGAALFVDGKYAEAQTEFGKYVRDYAQSSFSATAAYGVAACLEAQGKRDEAQAAYQNLSVRYPNSSVLDDAKLAVARIYEAKKLPEQALRVYEELAKPGAVSSAASEATRLKQDLLTSHPELAKTNAPAAVGSTMVVGTNAPAVRITNLVKITNLAPATAKP